MNNDSPTTSQPAPYTIVFASNETGVLPLSLAIWSLLKKAADSTTYDVYVLSDEISDESQNRLQGIVDNISSRHNLSFVDVTPVLSEKIKEGYVSYLPRSTWSRVFIPDLIPHVSRALYVDIDILVCDDCTPLFTMDMQGAAVGVVYEAVSSESTYFNRDFDIPLSYPGYFNAGVLLMDLDVFRRDNLSEHIMMCAAKYNGKLKAQDQDALNAALYDRAIRLHPRWNWHDWYTRLSLKANPKKSLWRAHEPLEVVEGSLYPGIIHFIGPRKPWRYNNRLMQDRYLEAIKESGLPGFLPLPGWSFKTWLNRILYAPMYALTWRKINKLAKKWNVKYEPKAASWGLASDCAVKGWPPAKK